MNEDFVSFSLAKKLTLKGFNAPCIAYYDEGVLRYNTKYPFALTAEELLISHNSEYTWVDAPTISQVLKWLREEKKMNVNMRLLVENGWYFSIQDYMGVQRYSILQDAKDTDDLYSSYEEAAIAGITYCLDNLI